MIYGILIGGLLAGVPIAVAIIVSLLAFMAMGEAPYSLRVV